MVPSLCAWTHLAVGAGLLEHPAEETQTCWEPWMRLDEVAHPTPRTGREGDGHSSPWSKEERASLQGCKHGASPGPVPEHAQDVLPLGILVSCKFRAKPTPFTRLPREMSCS